MPVNDTFRRESALRSNSEAKTAGSRHPRLKRVAPPDKQKGERDVGPKQAEASCVKRGRPNWTSTTVPMWQIDCENYRRTLLPFELWEVKDEHMEFVKAFCKTYGWKFTRRGSLVRFEPENLS